MSEASTGPLDYPTRAMELAKAGQTREAEDLYRRALSQAREKGDDFEQRFVEGRYADLLIQLERRDEAQSLLEHSIDAGSDLPASFGMLVDLYVRKREWARCEALLRREHALAVRQTTRAEARPPSAANFVRILANSGVKEGGRDPIERALNWAEELGDRQLLDEARHARGVLAEALDQIDAAISEYLRLANAGSHFEPTYTRLMILLERERRYGEALQIAQRALALRGSASFEQSTRKRIERLERKSAPRAHSAARLPIEPLLLREGAPILRWRGEIKVPGGVATLAITDDMVLASGIGKNAALWALDPSSLTARQGPPVRSRSAIAIAGNTVLAAQGTSHDENAIFALIGLPGMELMILLRLPRAVSDISSAPWGYALGCRDGALYTFDTSGRPIATHQLHRRVEEDAANVAYPYFVRCSSTRGHAIYSTWEKVRSVDETGKLAWEWALAGREETSDVGYGVKLRISFGPEVIRALEAAPDGGAYVVGGGQVWRIDARGKAAPITEAPEQYARLALDSGGDLVALSSWGKLQFFGRGAGSVALGERDNPNIEWLAAFGLLAAHDGVGLTFYERSGRLVSRYEFTKTINAVVSQDSTFIVAAAQPQLFEVVAP